MKKSVIAFVVLCGIIAGAIVYLNKEKSSLPPAPVVESTPGQTATPSPEKIISPKIEPPQAIPAASEPVKDASITPIASAAKSDDAADALHKSIDTLLSAKNGAQKHDLFQQLVKSGQIDAAIAELKQRATDNPNDAEIPTTLGEAMLNKLRAMRESGSDDYSAIGILAMQADQSFNAALKIDPQNWEAQFVKNSSMYYWPANSQMDNQVVQNLSKLIDQQETMTPQPEFAQTYLALGNQYLKMNQPDKAQATWQLGAQKFPGDQTLRAKLNGQ